MNKTNLTEEDHRSRSNFVRQLIQQSAGLDTVSSNSIKEIPRRIVQFWDNVDLPADVDECIATWKKTEKLGFKRLLFNKESAGDFIERKLGLRHKYAYDNCYHPAMQSDYFRLCYIYVEGGCYIDADDEYTGAKIHHLFDDNLLKIQPLCYNAATDKMISPQVFTKEGANSGSWTFYFNNNPLIANSKHPIIELALDRATSSLEKKLTDEFPEIQSTTGPGNLTKSIFDIITERPELKGTLLILNNWESTAKSKWNLSYRNDSRNWRLSNCESYKVR